MHFKLFCLLNVIGLSAVYGYGRLELENFCSFRDRNCMLSAIMCQGKAISEELTSFNECLLEQNLVQIEVVSNPVLTKPFFSKFRPRRQTFGGVEAQSDPSRRVENDFNSLTIKNYLTELNDANIAAEVRCCYGKKIGTFNEEGKPITEFFISRISTSEPKLTAEQLTAYTDAVNSCAPLTVDCNVIDFENCVQKTCIPNMKITSDSGIA